MSIVLLLVADVHALFVPAQSCGRRLEKSEIERLSVQRYVSIPGWLSDVQTDRLQADAAAVGACEHIFDCCVGMRTLHLQPAASHERESGERRDRELFRVESYYDISHKPYI